LELGVDGHEVRDGLLFIESKIFCVGADKTFVEDATGKFGEVFVLQGMEHARADLGGFGDLLDGDSAHLALALHSLAEGTHRTCSNEG
jgi:hypothetical protein